MCVYVLVCARRCAGMCARVCACVRTRSVGRSKLARVCQHFDARDGDVLLLHNVAFLVILVVLTGLHPHAEMSRRCWCLLWRCGVSDACCVAHAGPLALASSWWHSDVQGRPSTVCGPVSPEHVRVVPCGPVSPWPEHARVVPLAAAHSLALGLVKALALARLLTVVCRKGCCSVV